MIVLSLAQSFQILILISPGRIVSLVFTGALQRRLYHGKENNRMELLKDDRYWEVRILWTKSSPYWWLNLFRILFCFLDEVYAIATTVDILLLGSETKDT